MLKRFRRLSSRIPVHHKYQAFPYPDEMNETKKKRETLIERRFVLSAVTYTGMLADKKRQFIIQRRPNGLLCFARGLAIASNRYNCFVVRKEPSITSDDIRSLVAFGLERRLWNFTVLEGANERIWVFLLVKVAQGMIHTTMAGFVGPYVENKVLHGSAAFRNPPVL